MAILLRSDGSESCLRPKNRVFTNEELRGLLGGGGFEPVLVAVRPQGFFPCLDTPLIQAYALTDQFRRDLCLNQRASELLAPYVIRGNALFCARDEIR
jgi:hypothetical protein